MAMHQLPTQTLTHYPTPQSSTRDRLMADASDFDKYFNFDHNGYIAPKTDLPWITSAPSPVATDYKKALDELNQDYLTKKSHQYQQHRQQASLPLGSLSDLHSFNYNDSFFPLAYLGNNVLPSPVTDHPDFGVDMSHGTAQSLDADEIDFNTPLDYLTGDVTFSDPRPAIYVDNCINPAEIGGQEDLSPLPQPRPTSPDRLWPGIHQQYAEGTEAEALSQQSTQRPSPSPKSKTRKSDPVVDERISRLLCQMRQNNVATNDNNTTSPDVGGSSSQLARTKKDVEDMDEDERLLASEEGKNLTPGQRRQLRNKVSARAFRSRRKEYMTQLEEELGVKTAEAHRLKEENQRFVAENAQLTNLTRMLLAHPGFATILDELDPSGTTATPVFH